MGPNHAMVHPGPRGLNWEPRRVTGRAKGETDIRLLLQDAVSQSR